MAEKIDDLLVGLGLSVDQQSFQQGMGMFNSLRSAALGLGATFAAIGGARGVLNFAQGADHAGRMADNLNVSVGYLRQLGFAFEQVGGSSSDAVRDIETMRAIMDDVQTNPSGDRFALMANMGLDPEGIAMATNVMDAYQLLIERAHTLSPDARRVAMESLGLSLGSISLADEGPGFMREQMEYSRKTAAMTEEMVEQGREFNQELSKLNSNLTGITDAIMMDLLPELTSLLETINKWLGSGGAEEAKRIIDEGPVEAGRRAGSYVRERFLGFLGQSAGLDDPIDEAVLNSVGYVESRNRHRDASGRMITSPAGARGRWQIMPATARDPGYGVTPLMNNSEEEHQRFADDYLTALFRKYEGDLEATFAAYNAGPGLVDRLMREHPDNWLQYAPKETQDYVPAVLEKLSEERQSRGQDVTININSNQDPQAIANAVDNRLREHSQRAAQDYQTGIV